MELADQEALRELALEIGRFTNVDIQQIIKVDFIGFVQAVDAVGGVDIDVPYTLVDPEYPGPNYSYQTFSITKGPHHLDGETALKYARSRHSTSDFSRSGRQQQIIKALGEKVKNEGILSNPSKILSLVTNIFLLISCWRTWIGNCIKGDKFIAFTDNQYSLVINLAVSYATATNADASACFDKAPKNFSCRGIQNLAFSHKAITIPP